MSSIEAGKLFSVDGLVVVITGGGTGIGLMMAKGLEANGAKVYIVGRREEALKKAAEQAKYGNIIPIQGDVSSKEDLARIVSMITSIDGYINVLIANAGISGPTMKNLKPNPTISELREYLWNMDSQEFTKTYHINVTAVFFSIVTFLDLLDAGNKKGNVEQKSQVIATSSVGAFNRYPWAGYDYGTSKAALVHLMKQCATAFASYQIRSNIIAPGLYPSELASPAIEAMSDGTGKLPLSTVPLQRAGKEEDMAATVLFLTSRGGAYLNGQVLLTDGGRLSVLPSTY